MTDTSHRDPERRVEDVAGPAVGGGVGDENRHREDNPARVRQASSTAATGSATVNATQ